MLLETIFNMSILLFNISLQLSEICSPAKITSLIKQHIPDAKLSSEREGKLVYTLPLEKTNRFPGNVFACPVIYI